MSVRPNGLGASRSSRLHELDDATAARHRGFLDLPPARGEPRPRAADAMQVKPLAHLSADELLAESLRAANPSPAAADELDPITKWPLVVGTLVAAILLLVGLGAIGALPFR